MRPSRCTMCLFGRIVAAAVRAAGTVPVTVKMRKGIDDDTLTYLDAARTAEDAGAAAIALHARTAEQLYSGAADWSAIATLREAVSPSVPVLATATSGPPDDALAMMRETGCDGVVVGRGCLGKPWLFRELSQAFAGQPIDPAPTLGEVIDVMRRHVALLVDAQAHAATRRPRVSQALGWYLTGFAVGPSFDEL